MYKCSGCDFESNYKSSIVKHMKKLNKCTNDDIKIIKQDIKITCYYCSKKFSDETSRKRHMGVCKKINNQSLSQLYSSNIENNQTSLPQLYSSNIENKIVKHKKNNKINELTPSVIHIYLLQEREFIRLNQSVYKIGYTAVGLKRFKNYPHDSNVLLVKIFDNCNPEKELIDLFKTNFRQCVEIGKEYFEGDKNHMMDLIYNFGRT